MIEKAKRRRPPHSSERKRRMIERWYRVATRRRYVPGKLYAPNGYREVARRQGLL